MQCLNNKCTETCKQLVYETMNSDAGTISD
jgi:hypothetical protein